MRPKVLILIVALGLFTAGLLIWHAGRKAPAPPAVVSPEEVKTEAPASVTETTPETTPPVPVEPVPVNGSAPKVVAPGLVKTIVDLQADPFERQQKARELGKKLKPQEVKALYVFLLEKHSEDEKQTGHVLKNELMDVLCSQKPRLADLTGVLADIYHDTNQNVVIRDYAVQHLVQLYDELPRVENPAGAAPAAIEKILWEALEETDSSIAGTALLGLVRLVESRPELDRNRIGEAALKLASSDGTGGLTKVTALQACAQLQIKEALPVLVQTAGQNTDISLRISAIGAIGLLGGRTEMSLLQRIAGENNPRLTAAVTLALRRVQQRLE